MSDEHVFIRIDYDEFIPESYRAVVVEFEGVTARFLSDDIDVIQDWKAAKEYASCVHSERVIHHMSSVDHYISDLGDSDRSEEIKAALMEGAVC